MMTRLSKLKHLFSNWKYVFIAVIAALAYLSAYYYQITYTAVSFSRFFRSYSKTYVYPSLSLTVLIAIFVGITISLLVHNLRILRSQKTGAGSGFGGVFIGLLASGCPGCAVGLFPIVAGLLGISATLSSLPFNGLELQALSVGALGFSIYLLSKDSTCEVK